MQNTIAASPNYHRGLTVADAASASRRSWIDRFDLARFSAVTVTVLLFCLVAKEYHIEYPAFRWVLAICGAGFVMHHLTPARWRQWLFVGLSFACVLVVVGWERSGFLPVRGLIRTTALASLGLILIAICHLRVHFWARVALLGIVAAGYYSLRHWEIWKPMLSAVWSILGMMFMFRIMVYLYDLEHEKRKPTLSETLSYFFMLPNVVFPLFPVVDSKTFFKSRGQGETFAVYQKGLDFMFRGLIQLILVRIVEYQYLPKPRDIADGAMLVQFLVATSLMYMRVSGQFHLIIGLLHLFGFNLPETNRKYFLASSFTDYWRRVNIYWKDFMMKVFYYPIFFRLKKWGMGTALVIATLVTFAMTWLLHSYQFLWLRGDFEMKMQDSVFWGILAMLVMGNALWELKRGRTRKLAKGHTWKSLAGLALRTGGTFIIICVLWSLWTSKNFDEWFGIWQVADLRTLAWGLVVVGLVMVAALADALLSGKSTDEAGGLRPFSFVRLGFGCFLPLLLLIGLSQKGVRDRLPQRLAPLAKSLSDPERRALVRVGADRGYYEDLMDVGALNSQLWEMYNHQEPTWGEKPVSRNVNDFRLWEQIPGAVIDRDNYYAKFNRWGMRDQDYTQSRPRGTVRIALLGSSHVMGTGVNADRVFEAIVERRINENGSKSGARLEILNFSAGGYCGLTYLVLCEDRVPAFEPDIAIIVVHSIDPDWNARHIALAVQNRIPIPYPYLTDLAKRIGLTPRTGRALAEGKIRPYATEVTRWAYTQTAQRLRDRGILPVWVFMPLPLDTDPSGDAAKLEAIAREAGFITFQFADVFKGHAFKDLILTKYNDHSNAKAHALLADALQAAITADPRIDLAGRLARRAAQEPLSEPK